ncbi:hypothetical protein AN640_04960 [Candidatus Epulonipiscium fishelsonii]|uniref:Uncharacterized protein n=1 Tax=Candidatus Epulonipiscium fishelsonii TaxID=77094 RepID=A0ACC8XID0_9FIRM|nr:hypothetical protein AN640_04960 [Epulopiscium sp. SCG-D08WGA-EpuloA1]OON93419.1 MAG: hypothetical protein ATN32_08975 [Epulopiscium sp. AS2M-Bin002]
MAHKIEIRQLAIDYRNQGYTLEETCKVFKITRSTLSRWIKQYEQTGNLNRKVVTRQPRKLTKDDLKAYVEKNPYACLKEIADHFNCAESTIRYHLKNMKITRKKRRVTKKKLKR